MAPGITPGAIQQRGKGNTAYSIIHDLVRWFGPSTPDPHVHRVPGPIPRSIRRPMKVCPSQSGWVSGTGRA